MGRTQKQTRATRRPAGAPSPSRKFIVYVAVSADGFIARVDGSVDWLDRPDVEGHYGYADFASSVNTAIMGRKTYDFARAHGQGAFPGMRTYVLSRSHPPGPGGDVPEITFVDGDVKAFADRLRADGGKGIWLVGGAELIAAFLDAGAVDELIMHVIPTLIGEGIPLIAPSRRTLALELVSSERFEDCVVQLHYRIVSALTAAPAVTAVTAP